MGNEKTKATKVYARATKATKPLEFGARTMKTMQTRKFEVQLTKTTNT